MLSVGRGPHTHSITPLQLTEIKEGKLITYLRRDLSLPSLLRGHAIFLRFQEACAAAGRRGVAEQCRSVNMERGRGGGGTGGCRQSSHVAQQLE